MAIPFKTGEIIALSTQQRIRICLNISGQYICQSSASWEDYMDFFLKVSKMAHFHLNINS